MANALIGQRRTSVEIVHEILSVCDNGGANKTAIMYRGNLSYDQLRRYLALLSGRLLIHRNDQGRFQITAKGEKMLRRTSNVMRSLRDLRKEVEPEAYVEAV